MPSSEERVRALRPATGIIVTNRGATKESASGHVETTKEEYVCRLGGEYWRIRIAWTDRYIPPAGSDQSVLSKDLISAAEYEQAARGQQVEDTQDLLATINRKDQLQAELEELTPSCPKCKRKMRYRYSEKTKGHFWGCPIYPNCTGLINITAAQRSKIDQAAKLGVFPGR